MYKKHDQRTHDIYSTTSDSQGALRSEEHAQPKLQKARHKTQSHAGKHPTYVAVADCSCIAGQENRTRTNTTKKGTQNRNVHLSYASPSSKKHERFRPIFCKTRALSFSSVPVGIGDYNMRFITSLIHSTHRTINPVTRILLSFKASSPKTPSSDGRERSMLLDKCKTGFRERIPKYIPWSTNEHRPPISSPGAAAGKMPWRSRPRLPHMTHGTAIQKQGIVLRKRDKRWQPAHCQVALVAISRWWTMMETIWLIQTVSQLPSGKLWIRVAIFDFLHSADHMRSRLTSHLWRRRKRNQSATQFWTMETVPGTPKLCPVKDRSADVEKLSAQQKRVRKSGKLPESRAASQLGERASSVVQRADCHAIARLMKRNGILWFCLTMPGDRRVKQSNVASTRKALVEDNKRFLNVSSRWIYSAITADHSVKLSATAPCVKTFLCNVVRHDAP